MRATSARLPPGARRPIGLRPPSLPVVASVACGIAIVAQGVGTVVSVARIHSIDGVGRTEDRLRIDPGQRPSEIARVIAAAHLFGRETGPAEEGGAEPKLEGGGLALRGVVASTDPADARVIIATGNTSQQIYRSGETLPGGYAIARIAELYVLLARGETRMRLELPRDGAGPVTSASRVGTPSAPLGPPVAASELAAANLQLLRDAQDNVVGLRTATPKQWEIPGLRADDVIVAIDSVPVDHLAHTPSAIMRLAAGGRPNRIAVMRGSRILNLAPAPPPQQKRHTRSE